MIETTDGVVRALETLRDFSPASYADAEDAWRAEFTAALEDRAELLRRLSVLDEPGRAAIVLRYVGGLSAAEVGRLLGVSQSTCRRLTERALERLAAPGGAGEVASMTA